MKGVNKDTSRVTISKSEKQHNWWINLRPSSSGWEGANNKTDKPPANIKKKDKTEMHKLGMRKGLQMGTEEMMRNTRRGFRQHLPDPMLMRLKSEWNG